jgi:predicted transcriptional regulator
MAAYFLCNASILSYVAWLHKKYIRRSFYMHLRYVSKVMTQKRSRDQIKSQILALCQEDGANKTRIVYQVGLNFRTVNGYLDLLLEKGLLEAIPGAYIMYKTTEKGERAFEGHKAIEAIYS